MLKISCISHPLDADARYRTIKRHSATLATSFRYRATTTKLNPGAGLAQCQIRARTEHFLYLACLAAWIACTAPNPCIGSPGSQMQTGMQHIVSARSDDELRMLIRGLVSGLLARVGSIPLSSDGTKAKRKRSTSAYAQPSLSGDRHDRQGQVILSTLSGLASFVLNVPLWTQRQNGNDTRNDWTGELPDTVYDARGSSLEIPSPKRTHPQPTQWISQNGSRDFPSLPACIRRHSSRVVQMIRPWHWPGRAIWCP